MPVPNWYEPLVMPGILTFFGLLIWWMAMMAEEKGKPASWKWFGFALLLIAMGFGFQSFEKMIGQSPDDLLYRSSLPSNRRFAMAHYAAFVIPALAIVGCIVWQFAGKKPAPAETPATE